MYSLVNGVLIVQLFKILLFFYFQRIDNNRMASLTFRQDKILEQLNELKSKLELMQNELGVSASQIVSSTIKVEQQPVSHPVKVCGKKMAVYMAQQFMHRQKRGIAVKPIEVSFDTWK